MIFFRDPVSKSGFDNNTRLMLLSYYSEQSIPIGQIEQKNSDIPLQVLSLLGHSTTQTSLQRFGALVLNQKLYHNPHIQNSVGCS